MNYIVIFSEFHCKSISIKSHLVWNIIIRTHKIYNSSDDNMNNLKMLFIKIGSTAIETSKKCYLLLNLKLFSF